MNKKYFLITLLYITSSYTHVQDSHSWENHDRDDRDGDTRGWGSRDWVYKPMTLSFPGLATLDSTRIVNVTKMVEVDTKIEHLLAILTKPLEVSLAGLVILAQEGKLTAEQQAKYLKMYLDRFMKFSASYLNDVRPFKPVLVKLIEYWAHQRNRADSLALMWANIEHGKEEQFAQDFPPTLEAFYTFLVDIDMLLKDIMHSCPKSYAYYLECKKIIEEKHNQHA